MILGDKPPISKVVLSHLGTIWYTVYFFAIACFRSLSLGADDFGNLQELDFQDFERQPAGEQGK
jgi:hypothetical protein